MKGQGDKDARKVSSDFAQAIEKHLFRTATSLKAYADPSTINSRLRLVCVALQRRRLQKTQKLQRSSVMKQALGDARYDETMNLLAQIRDLKVEFVSQSCSKCTMKGGCERADTRLQAQRVVPERIRRLFFNTRLVTVVDAASMDQLLNQDWDALIEQALANVHFYQSWKVSREGGGVSRSRARSESDVDEANVIAI